jgi:uncharacterized protein
MPGKENGNRSDIYANRIFKRIISQFDYLIDLHTASFGRINSFYVRADLSNQTISKMAELLGPEVILHNPGSIGTIRRAATDIGIPSITVELRDPYKFQKKIIKDGAIGIHNILRYLQFEPGEVMVNPGSTLCKNSYWIYTTVGGLLTVVPSLLTKVKKGDVIARVRDIFGDVIKEYVAPEDGIVIGKSVSPINQTGSRIIHLGILK